MKQNGINYWNWKFSDQPFKDVASFEKALRSENAQITTEDWNPAQTASESKELLLQYMCCIEAPEELLDNEFLSDEDKNTFAENPDEKLHQVDILAKLSADNGKYFTAVELLFKAHNQLASKNLGDHVFFEEIALEPRKVDSLPVFYVSAGS